MAYAEMRELADRLMPLFNDGDDDDEDRNGLSRALWLYTFVLMPFDS